MGELMPLETVVNLANGFSPVWVHFCCTKLLEWVFSSVGVFMVMV